MAAPRQVAEIEHCTVDVSFEIAANARVTFMNQFYATCFAGEPKQLMRAR
jgi:hypothetical protein